MKSDFLFWKNYFSVYDQLNNLIPYQELLSDIANALEIHDGEVVFDAGSGTGNLALKIKESGGQVVGIDMSKAGTMIHKQKLPESLVILGDLAKPLPFEDASFDKICSNNVIYTLSTESRVSVFKEFYRVLKPGGIIVIANLSERFKPLHIYLDHIRKDLRRDGLINTAVKLLKFSVPTAKIFYYNYLIKTRYRREQYRFMEHHDQINLLKNAGFRNISDNKLVYSGQSILNKAYK